MHPEKAKLLSDLADLNAQAIKLAERATELATGAPGYAEHLERPISDAIMKLAGSVAVTEVSDRFGKPRPQNIYNMNQTKNFAKLGWGD